MTDLIKNANDRSAPPSAAKKNGSVLNWFTKRKKPGHSFSENSSLEIHDDLVSDHERILLSNIVKLRDVTVIEVMVPRADIFALDALTTQNELFELLAERQFSRVPVYKGTLDDVMGTIHIKDVMAAIARGEEVHIEKLVKDVPIVSPAMNILDLLLKMRQSRRHMAFVVDEYGGIDGLVTINDVLESIIGEVYDEHDHDEAPKIIEKDDGSILVDARLSIEEFEDRFGSMLSTDERNDSDTLGGLVFALAGRIPARGEVIAHENGMIFDILDADPRRINLLRVRNIPAAHAPSQD